MDEIFEMSHPQRIATMAVITSIEDPKFDIDVWLNREQFFAGYAKEKVAYKQRKMGYKKPVKKDVISKVASMGIPTNKIAEIIKEQTEEPKKQTPVKKPEKPINLTPVRGVQRVPPSSITDYFNQNQ